MFTHRWVMTRSMLRMPISPLFRFQVRFDLLGHLGAKLLQRHGNVGHLQCGLDLDQFLDYRAFGYRDHSGVGRAVRRVEQGKDELQRTVPRLEMPARSSLIPV